MEPKFSDGEQATIIDCFWEPRIIDGPGENTYMREMAGEIITLRHCNSCYSTSVWYHCDENEWTWDERWLEKIKQFDIDEDSVMAMFK